MQFDGCGAVERYSHAVRVQWRNVVDHHSSGSLWIFVLDHLVDVSLMF